MISPIYNRVLLKFSGEVLAGESANGIDFAAIDTITAEIIEAKNLGIQVGLVFGGGNIFRGLPASSTGIDRAAGDYMGMLATVINALAVQNSLEKSGMETRLLSAIKMDEVAEPYIRRRAMRHLDKGRIVLFSAGTGSPYFTTDTAAALRAIEIGADVIIKGTKVDGIYDMDPEIEKNATYIPHLTYLEVLEKGLRVMDSTAVSLCMENDLPIRVFNMRLKGNLIRLLSGEDIGTTVSGEKNAG